MTTVQLDNVIPTNAPPRSLLLTETTDEHKDRFATPPKNGQKRAGSYVITQSRQRQRLQRENERARKKPE